MAENIVRRLILHFLAAGELTCDTRCALAAVVSIRRRSSVPAYLI